VPNWCYGLFLIAVAISGNSFGQEGPSWKPDKHVEVIVPFAPGTALDHAARGMQGIWSANRILPVSSTVINKPGGGGALGWLYLDQHAKDAHYVAIGSPTLLTNQIIGTGKASYTDFTLLAMILTEYTVFAVRADSPVKSGTDLIQRLRGDPQSISISVGSALGNTNHIALASIAGTAGINSKKLKAVAFASAGAGMTALLGGHVDLAVSSLGVFVPQVEAGKLRLIAVGAPHRLSGSLAQIPTWKEQGVAAESGSWRVMLGPRGISDGQIRYWEDVFLQLSKNQEWQSLARTRYLEPVFRDSRTTRASLDADYAQLKAVLGDLGMARK
jgi:putative tricarboxylic transport membrane protein